MKPSFKPPVFQTQFAYMPELFDRPKPALPVCKKHLRTFELARALGLSEMTVGTLYGKRCPECSKTHWFSEAKRYYLELATRLDIFQDDWPAIKAVIQKHQALCASDEDFLLALVQSARAPDIQAEELPELDIAFG